MSHTPAIGLQRSSLPQQKQLQPLCVRFMCEYSKAGYSVPAALAMMTFEVVSASMAVRGRALRILVHCHRASRVAKYF
jgi:hypothetical protein